MAYIYDGWSPKQFALAGHTFNKIKSNRKFGIELEFDSLPENYIEMESATIFGAKEDPSVRGGEFLSPILKGDRGIEACELFCDEADNRDFKVTSECGYHLHCDVSSENSDRVKAALVAYYHTRKFWQSTVTSHRAGNMYCRNLSYSPDSLEDLNSNTDLRQWSAECDRYQWLNPASYHVHGTLEIRIHEGTSNKIDVTNWIKAHTAFIDATCDMSVGQVTRLFSNKRTIDEQFREIRVMLADNRISEHLKYRHNLNTSA